MAAATHGTKRKRDEAEDDAPGGVKAHTLFVGNLDPRTNEYQLLQLFKAHGALLRIDYMWHKIGPRRGTPRGYAFIEYGSREEGEAARAALGGKVVNGRPLAVHFSTDEAAAAAAAAASRVGIPGNGGGGGPAGARALAKQREREREFMTPEEERVRRTAATVSAARASTVAARVSESTVDARLAAIKAQLQAMKAAQGSAVSSCGATAETVGTPAQHAQRR